MTLQPAPAPLPANRHRGRGSPNALGRPVSRADKPDAIDVHVGERIKLRRRMVAMAQTTLAEAIGVTFQQVQKYESGHNRTSASRLWDIAVALQTTPGFFYMGIGPEVLLGREVQPEVIHIDDDPLADMQTLELIAAYSRLKDRDTRDQVLAVVKKLRGGEE